MTVYQVFFHEACVGSFSQGLFTNKEAAEACAKAVAKNFGTKFKKSKSFDCTCTYIKEVEVQETYEVTND
jgi:hypothetical protein